MSQTLMPKNFDVRHALAASLTTDLVNTLCTASPSLFKRRADVENALGNRLRDLAAMQRIGGVKCGDDFVVTDDGEMITSVIWSTGYTRGNKHLVLSLAPTGKIREHEWITLDPTFEPTVMSIGVLPDLRVDVNSSHLAMRRFRVDPRSRPHFEPAMVANVIENAVRKDAEVLRTVFKGDVSWAVPVPFLKAYAMVSVDRQRRVLVCSTMLNPLQIQRHVNSAYLGKHPMAFGGQQ